MTSEIKVEHDIDSTIEIDVIKYAAFRRKEIELLHSESFMSKEDKHKSLFQMLPRHMRRRTMGYIRKRLPHKIRSSAIIKPPSKIIKRPSRKYRRRPSNLVKEYERRKRAMSNKTWLETHIWHAKRFHMSDSLYGYRLPLFENCKNKRAIYKCLNKACCIHDESYYVCHELEGERDFLIKALSRICSQKAGLTFASKMLLNGQYEGRTILYEKDKYPFGCIGPVRFLWEYSDVSSNLDISQQKRLWIWSHPSITEQVETQLIDSFDLKPKSSSIDKIEEIEFESTISDKQSVKLKSLKDKLVRFKLLGPLSTTLLGHVLKTFEDNQSYSYYRTHADIWNKFKFSLRFPNDITCQTVISLLVKDPRLSLPKKKMFNKVKQKNEDNFSNDKQYDLINLIRSNNLSKSEIWNQEYILNDLNKNKKSTHTINKIRSQFLLPGTENLTNLENHSKIPVILIQNALNNNLNTLKNGNLYSGWDLIVPSTWGMAFWLTLVHHGARALGQNEIDYLLFESGNLKFPNEFLDTKSSQTQNEQLKHELFKKYSARPPSKRINYLKSGFLSPFYFPTKSLVNIYNFEKNSMLDSSSSFFILRNKFFLNNLANKIFNKNKQNKQLKFELFENLTEMEMKNLSRSFICVRLLPVGKGKIEKFSLLYESKKLNDSDYNMEKIYSKMVVNKMVSNFRSEFLLSLDEKTKTNANLVQQKSKLNKLIKNKFNKQNILTNEDYFEKYFIELEDSSFSRKPIGFVCNSSFTLVNGKFGANGFLLTQFLIDSIAKENNSDLSILDYKTTSSTLYNHVKIKQIYI